MVRKVVEEGLPVEVASALNNKTENIKQKATTIFDGTLNHDYTEEEIARRGTDFMPTTMIDMDRRREANKNPTNKK